VVRRYIERAVGNESEMLRKVRSCECENSRSEDAPEIAPETALSSASLISDPLND
jgi:hypothetical protein